MQIKATERGSGEEEALRMLGFALQFLGFCCKGMGRVVPLAELGSRMIMGWMGDLQFKHIIMEMFCEYRPITCPILPGKVRVIPVS